jgi:hypothetical protein
MSIQQIAFAVPEVYGLSRNCPSDSSFLDVSFLAQVNDAIRTLSEGVADDIL